MTEKIHIYYFDFLKIIAILMVLFNHTDGCYLFTDRQNSIMFLPYLLIYICVKMAVPLFFMISGALLLGKEEKYSKVLFYRVFRFICILLIVSLILYIYKIHFDFSKFSLQDFLTITYSKKMSVGLWYLYSYIGYLIMLPLLRNMVKHFSKADFIYFVAFYIVLTGFVPIIQYIVSGGSVNISTYFRTPIFAQNIFFPIAGYCINSNELLGNPKKSDIYITIAIGLFSICATAFMICYQKHVEGAFKETFSETLTSIHTCIFFMLVKYKFQKHQISNVTKQILSFFGRLTFGIYLFEQVYRDVTKPVLYFCLKYMKSMPAYMLWVLCATLFGALISYILKKIPVINKFI